jgi:lactobin A/cerein 7B family class IIb bacteriocin
MSNTRTTTDALAFAEPQVLTDAEIDQVSGGIFPLIAVVALICAAAVGYGAAKATK